MPKVETVLALRICLLPSCAVEFQPEHNRQTHCCKEHAYKNKMRRDSLARAQRNKERAAIKPLTPARSYHIERMNFARIIDGQNVPAGSDVCMNPRCRTVYVPNDPRQRCCVPACAKTLDHIRQAEKRRLRQGRKPKVDREIIVRQPRQTPPRKEIKDRYFDGCCGFDSLGDIPWGHSWSGTDPLPT